MLSRSDSENIASNYFRPKRASQILSTDPMKSLGECPAHLLSSSLCPRPSANREGLTGRTERTESDRPGPQLLSEGETQD